MTSYERLRAAMLGQEVDHTPFSPFLAYVWEHYPKEVQQQGQLAFHHRIGADPLWRGCNCPVNRIDHPDCHIDRREVGDLAHTLVTTPVGSLHSTQQRSDQGNTWFLIEHPLKTIEDFKVQLWIEEHARLAYDDTATKKHLAGDGKEGLSIGLLTPRGKTAFQSLVEHHMGTEELAYALADCPDPVNELVAAMVDLDQRSAALAAEAPFDFFLTWEDSSTQNYSPSQYRQYIASQISGWCQLLKSYNKHYIQHACGHVKDLLPTMVEQGNLGVESISPQPTGNISIRDARKSVGNNFTIIGGIEPTHLLRLEGKEFDAYVEEVLGDGSPGAFVLANSDSCPPGVTEAKFARAAAIARTWRK